MSKWIPEYATHYSIQKFNTDPNPALNIVFYNCNVPYQAKPISQLAHELAISDVCQQIREKPLSERMAMPKQERYLNEETGDDFVDVTYKQMPWDRFVGAMQWTIGKYFDRFGRKDDIVAEAYKIKDYANRFYEKTVLEAEKQKKISEKV